MSRSVKLDNYLWISTRDRNKYVTFNELTAGRYAHMVLPTGTPLKLQLDITFHVSACAFKFPQSRQDGGLQWNHYEKSGYNH